MVQKARIEGTYFCSLCGAKVSSGAETCSDCGAGLEGVMDAAFCDACGAIVQVSSSECEVCGISRTPAARVTVSDPMMSLIEEKLVEDRLVELVRRIQDALPGREWTRIAELAGEFTALVHGRAGTSPPGGAEPEGTPASPRADPGMQERLDDLETEVEMLRAKLAIAEAKGSGVPPGILKRLEHARRTMRALREKLATSHRGTALYRVVDGVVDDLDEALSALGEDEG